MLAEDGEGVGEGREVGGGDAEEAAGVWGFPGEGGRVGRVGGGGGGQEGGGRSNGGTEDAAAEILGPGAELRRVGAHRLREPGLRQLRKEHEREITQSEAVQAGELPLRYQIPLLA